MQAAVLYVAVGPDPTLRGNPATRCPPSTARSYAKMPRAARRDIRTYFVKQLVSRQICLHLQREERHWQLVRGLYVCVGETHTTLRHETRITGMANGIRKSHLEFPLQPECLSFYLARKSELHQLIKTQTQQLACLSAQNTHMHELACTKIFNTTYWIAK